MDSNCFALLELLSTAQRTESQLFAMKYVSVKQSIFIKSCKPRVQLCDTCTLHVNVRSMKYCSKMPLDTACHDTVIILHLCLKLDSTVHSEKNELLAFGHKWVKL